MTGRNITIASLVLSFGMVAGATAQQDPNLNHHDLQRGSDNTRYADRWTEAESPYYRQWYNSTYSGQPYRDYNHLKQEDQRRYWEWRHQQQDRNHGDHNDHERDRNDNSPR